MFEHIKAGSYPSAKRLTPLRGLQDLLAAHVDPRIIGNGMGGLNVRSISPDGFICVVKVATSFNDLRRLAHGTLEVIGAGAEGASKRRKCLSHSKPSLAERLNTRTLDPFWARPTSSKEDRIENEMSRRSYI